jgi:hypothetical protein
MNISNAKYVAINDENNSITATIDGKVMFVPLDPNNRHYQEIQEWVAKGNTIEEAD